MTEGGLVNLLFVCTANICRSAYAQLLADHMLAGRPDVHVSSAGTYGFRDHVLDPPMAAQAQARGVDTERFRSRPLTMLMVDDADLVVTAEASHRQFILDERPAAFRRVLTFGQLAHVLDGAGDELADRTAAQVIDVVRSSFRPADAADDVVDPYGRGDAAAAQAAQRLDALVAKLVTALGVEPGLVSGAERRLA